MLTFTKITNHNISDCTYPGLFFNDTNTLLQAQAYFFLYLVLFFSVNFTLLSHFYCLFVFFFLDYCLYKS